MQANNSSSSHSKDSNNSSSHSKDNIGTVVSLDGGGGGVGDVLDFESMDRDLILRDWILSNVQWSWSSSLVNGIAWLYVFFRSSATSSGRGAQTLLMVYIIVLWFY